MTLRRLAWLATFGLLVAACAPAPTSLPPSAAGSAAPTPSAFAYEGQFTPAGSVAITGVGGTATLLANGKVLLAGGSDRATSSTTFATAGLYDPSSQTFRPTGSMLEARSGATATLLADGNVLIAGGAANASLLTAELYDPAARNSQRPAH